MPRGPKSIPSLPEKTNGIKCESKTIQKDSKNKEKKMKLKCKSESRIKQGQTSYLFFYLQSYQQIRKDNQFIQLSQVAKEVGKIWKKLSEVEKEPFVQMARNDRQRYVKEMLAQQDEELKKEKCEKSKKVISENKVIKHSKIE